MKNLLLYITCGAFLSLVSYIALIIWDRNRISALFSNQQPCVANRRQKDKSFTPRTVFDGSNDDCD